MFLTDVMTYLMKGTLTNIKAVLKGDGKTLGEVGVDSTPTAESKNLITSGGVKSALDAHYPQNLYFGIAKNASKVLTFGASFKGAMFIYSTSASHDGGLYIVSTTSGAVVWCMPINGKFDVVTVSASGSIITIANGLNSQAQVVVLTFNGDPPTVTDPTN